MKYYCIGIKGAGMSTLACILKDLGNEVCGYDDIVDYKFTEEGLKKRKITIYHDSEHKLPKDIIVTYSAAFNIDHKEIQRVKKLGLKIVKYHDILGNLSKMFETISVCGTHGKTTTSTLLAHILKETIGCNYFIGDGSGFANKKNKLFVLESCEFNKHFLAYYPTYTIITNIELEHTECYKDLDEIIKTFASFANKSSKMVIACGDDENILKLKLNKKVIYYGFNNNNNIIAKNIKLTENGSIFDVYINNKLYGNFSLPLYGKHMILNTLASIAIFNEFNIQSDVVHNLLLNFQNAKKRFSEEKFKGNIIIDDYAHHPTEIKVTLNSARQKYPNRKIIAVFIPNTYSRTLAFPMEFAESLNLADESYITEIKCNREKKEDYNNITSKIILDKMHNGKMISEETINQITNEKNAVICFMSCADTSHIINAFKKES